MISGANSLSGDYISKVGLTALSTSETNLRTAIEKVSSNGAPTTVDMLDLQQQVQQWTMMVQVVSTLTKEVSDALKGVVQKSS